MNRRGFLAALGKGAAAVAMAPAVKLLAPAVAPPYVITNIDRTVGVVTLNPADVTTMAAVMKGIYPECILLTDPLCPPETAWHFQMPWHQVAIDFDVVRP